MFKRLVMTGLAVFLLFGLANISAAATTVNLGNAGGFASYQSIIGTGV